MSNLHHVVYNVARTSGASNLLVNLSPAEARALQVALQGKNSPQTWLSVEGLRELIAQSTQTWPGNNP